MNNLKEWLKKLPEETDKEEIENLIMENLKKICHVENLSIDKSTEVENLVFEMIMGKVSKDNFIKILQRILKGRNREDVIRIAKLINEDILKPIKNSLYRKKDIDVYY